MSKKKTLKHGISLCMVVKDEECSIERCISSVRSIVEEIVVVDTGSSDRTPEIARRLGATVIHFQWNDDFADARNVSLRGAGYSWILVLDADEVIAERDVARVRSVTSLSRPS